MKVSNVTRTLLLMAATALLSACGGGGGSGNDSGFNPPGAAISSPASVSINTNSAVSVTVRATQAGGAPVPNGTVVTATVSPSSAGNIASITGTTSSGTPAAQTTGGNAVFYFQSGGQPGTATLNFAMQDPSTPGRTISTSTAVTIGTGAPNDPRVQFQSTATTLASNPYWGQGYEPFIGSPYISEVTLNLRSASGQPFTGEAGVAISPVDVAAFSTLDDPSTTNIDEFENLLGAGPVDVVAGQATVFVHSFNPGTAVLQVSFVDPDTGQSVIGRFTITVGAQTPPLPANVEAGPANGPVYVQGSGGRTFTTFSVRVEDGAGQEVPDPVSGNTAFNNVRLEILGEGAAAGERLSGVNAQGQNVEGTVIDLRTRNGIAGATFRAGTRTGTTTIRVTADRADNNVDNGITDPVVDTFTIVIGDGRLFGIELSVPASDALFVNQVIDDPEVIEENPDGTYSVTITAIATDRTGNPVIPGTVISFGLVDEPQNGFPQAGGGFAISGPDGNPQEAGTLFTAPSGQFLTAGGGAGPGDTLLLFGEEVTGNHDHESARTVASVDSQTRLTVTRRFNRNDHTGSIVDSGPVIPYIVGRAEDATIPASAVTDELGVATTRYTFPVSQLGKPVAIWAQGEGEVINNIADTVGDVEILFFFGAAPATLSVSPNPIPGNRSVEVLACVYDANLNPMQGLPVSFQFSGLGGGSGSIDGVSGSGIMPQRTGPDGCATGTVTTSGVPPQLTSQPQVVFSAAGQSEVVPIVVNVALLTAVPNFVAVPIEGAEPTISLQLLDDQGQGVPGVAISVACGGGGQLTVLAEPGQSGLNGRTGARIRACGFAEGVTATCTFTAASGQTATTVFQGTGGPGASPAYGGCGVP